MQRQLRTQKARQRTCRPLASHHSLVCPAFIAVTPPLHSSSCRCVPPITFTIAPSAPPARHRTAAAQQQQPPRSLLPLPFPCVCAVLRCPARHAALACAHHSAHAAVAPPASQINPAATPRHEQQAPPTTAVLLAVVLHACARETRSRQRCHDVWCCNTRSCSRKQRQRHVSWLFAIDRQRQQRPK